MLEKEKKKQNLLHNLLPSLFEGDHYNLSGRGLVQSIWVRKVDDLDVYSEVSQGTHSQDISQTSCHLRHSFDPPAYTF